MKRRNIENKSRTFKQLNVSKRQVSVLFFIRAQLLNRGRTFIILAMCFLYLVQYFFPFSTLNHTLSIVGIVIFFMTIFYVGNTQKTIAIVLFLLGVVVHVSVKEQPLFSSFVYIQRNLPILTLIILVPLISIPIKAGGYFKSVQYFMIKTRSRPKLSFIFLSSFLGLISPILNMGTVRIVHEMVDGLKLNPRLLANSYMTGFTSAMLWSPYFASVVIVLYEIGADIQKYVLLALPVAIVYLLVGNLLFSLKYDDKQNEYINLPLNENGKQTERFHLINISKLLSFLFMLIGLLLVIEAVTKLPMLLIVSLIAIFVPTIWGLSTRKFGELLPAMRSYFNGIWFMKNEITLFLSAGFFASAIAKTPITEGIEYYLLTIANISILLFALIIFFIVFILAFIGVHQIIVVPILASQIQASVIGITPEMLALIFILSWSVTVIICPLSAINIIVSNCVKQNGFTVGFKWNGRFVVSIVSLVFFIVYLSQFF